MATIFGRCHTELPPSLQDALGEGHELPGLGSLPENPKIEPVHRKIKLTITLMGIRTQNLHFLGGGLGRQARVFKVKLKIISIEP